MNRYQTALAVGVALVAASAVQAQPVATTQASVGGATGDPTYSVRVIGADGVAYNCRPDVTQVDGSPARLCRRATGGGGGNGALEGGTITAGGAAAIGVVAIALVAGSDSDDSTTASTTTTTN
ncbi:MAG: hypothetical protein AAFZ99_09115 [Pseudomonadota bacterium]